MNNLTTHMANLRDILATIENKNLNEGAAGETVELFAKRLLGKTGKELVKELGPKVTINGVKTIKGKVREIEEVWEHMPGRETYEIKTVNGKVPKTSYVKTAEALKTEVELAAKEGRVAVSTSENVGKNVVKPTAPGLDPAADATAKAEKLSIAELEKRIASGEGTALERKAFADELAKKKASAPPAEVPKDKFDNSAEIARKKAEGMKREELEAALKNKDIPAVTRKEFEAELAKRQKVDAPATTVTIDTVVVKKAIEKEKDEVKLLLDNGTVKVKDENLLPKKPNETPTEQVERTLKEDPAYKGAWEGIEGTEKEIGFWKWFKGRGLVTLAVALGVAGSYQYLKNNKDDKSEEEEVLVDPKQQDANTANDQEGPPALDLSKKNEKKNNTPQADTSGENDPEVFDVASGRQMKKSEQEKLNAQRNSAGEVQQAPKVVGGTPTEEQKTELTKLKTQIDTLVAELEKSKDPEIQKRLAAVKAKLGEVMQSAKKISNDEPYEASGWYDIGRGFRRWYGKTGVDPETGRVVTTGTTDIIPIDKRKRDKYDDMAQSDLANQLRKKEQPQKSN